MVITSQQLKLICPTIPADEVEKIASSLTEICPQYGIDTPDIFHEFIANLAHESQEFNRREENLKYSSAKRLMTIWPSRFASEADAQQYVYNPEKLANKVYGGRVDLGNVQQGDGWLFRGGGYIQTTGRRNYTLFTAYYNRRFGTSFTIEQIAHLIRETVDMAIHSACWIFAISMKLIDEAQNDMVKTIRKRVAGSLFGLDEVNMYYERAKRVIV